MAKFDWEKAKKKPGGTVQVATLGQTEKIEGDIKNMPLKSSKPSSEPAQTVNAEEYKKDMQRHAKKRAYQKQYRANKKAKAIKGKENQKDRRRSFESGKRQERERIIQIIEKRKAYDCRCFCDCHSEEAPCTTCQADNELIEIIKGENK